VHVITAVERGHARQRERFPVEVQEQVFDAEELDRFTEHDLDLFDRSAARIRRDVHQIDRGGADVLNPSHGDVAGQGVARRILDLRAGRGDRQGVSSARRGQRRQPGQRPGYRIAGREHLAAGQQIGTARSAQGDLVQAESGNRFGEDNGQHADGFPVRVGPKRSDRSRRRHQVDSPAVAGIARQRQRNPVQDPGSRSRQGQLIIAFGAGQRLQTAQPPSDLVARQQRLGPAQQVRPSVASQRQVGKVQPGHSFVKHDRDFVHRAVARVRRHRDDPRRGPRGIDFPDFERTVRQRVSDMIDDPGTCGRQGQGIRARGGGQRAQAAERPGDAVGRSDRVGVGQQVPAAVAAEYEVRPVETADRFAERKAHLIDPRAPRVRCHRRDGHRRRRGVRGPLRGCSGRQGVPGFVHNPRVGGDQLQRVRAGLAGHLAQVAQRPVDSVGRGQRLFAGQHVAAAVARQPQIGQPKTADRLAEHDAQLIESAAAGIGRDRGNGHGGRRQVDGETADVIAARAAVGVAVQVDAAGVLDGAGQHGQFVVAGGQRNRGAAQLQVDARRVVVGIPRSVRGDQRIAPDIQLIAVGVGRGGCIQLLAEDQGPAGNRRVVGPLLVADDSRHDVQHRGRNGIVRRRPIGVDRELPPARAHHVVGCIQRVARPSNHDHIIAGVDRADAGTRAGNGPQERTGIRHGGAECQFHDAILGSVPQLDGQVDRPGHRWRRGTAPPLNVVGPAGHPLLQAQGIDYVDIVWFAERRLAGVAVSSDVDHLPVLGRLVRIGVLRIAHVDSRRQVLDEGRGVALPQHRLHDRQTDRTAATAAAEVLDRCQGPLSHLAERTAQVQVVVAPVGSAHADEPELVVQAVGVHPDGPRRRIQAEIIVARNDLPLSQRRRQLAGPFADRAVGRRQDVEVALPTRGAVGSDHDVAADHTAGRVVAPLDKHGVVAQQHVRAAVGHDNADLRTVSAGVLRWRPQESTAEDPRAPRRRQRRLLAELGEQRDPLEARRREGDG